ncbi:MAG: hypothetical protein ACRCST_11625 [Turicibacter sp.]
MNIWKIYQYNLLGFITHYFYKEFETTDGTGEWYDIPSHPNKGTKLFFEDFQIEIIKKIDKFMLSERTALRIAIKSCKGAGKTRLLALIMIWACMCFEYPRVRGMSSTQRQTSDVLLGACKELLATANFTDLFQFNKLTIHLLEDTGYPSQANMIAGIVSNSTTIDSVAGDHSQSMNLYVIDEASTLDTNVYNVLQGIFTSGKGIMILAGNTTDTTGSSIFYKIFNDPQYQSFYHYHVPDSALKRTRNNNSIERRKSYQEGTEQYKIFIDAEFCDNRDYTFLATEDINNMLDRDNYIYLDDMVNYNSSCVIGIDVSYGVGKDYTCIISRCNNQAEILFYSNITRPNDIIEKIQYYYNCGARIVIDISGIGRDLLSNLRARGITNIPDIALQTQSIQHTKFVNRKSELFYLTRDWAINNTVFLNTKSSLEKQNFTSECKLIRWELDDLGRYNIGRKLPNEKSPDILDALSYTFYYGIVTKESKNVVSKLNTKYGFGY